MEEHKNEYYGDMTRVCLAPFVCDAWWKRNEIETFQGCWVAERIVCVSAMVWTSSLKQSEMAVDSCRELVKVNEFDRVRRARSRMWL